MKNSKVTSVEYNADPGRYTLVDGNHPNAPTCASGNRFQLVGFDTSTKQYVRFTKSVFKRLFAASQVNEGKPRH